MKIKIQWNSGEITATLIDTPTSKKLLNFLPIESTASTWGEEIYFKTLVDSPLEDDARQVVDPGTICFWVEGSSLAIPFGPTPISEGDECRLVTAVNILGMCDSDPRVLESVKDGDRILVVAG
jgi:uncharacterized protein